jgi:hypothetical protein
MWSAEAELLQAAEANASATPKALARGSPLPLCGRGLGVRATKNAHALHTANSSDVPLSGLGRGVVVHVESPL